MTTRNPQANATIEQCHQTSGNIIQNFQLHKEELDEDDPWSGVLATAACAVHATAHTTLQATPVELVFRHDAVSNIKFEANWQAIKECKQVLTNENDAEQINFFPFLQHIMPLNKDC